MYVLYTCTYLDTCIRTYCLLYPSGSIKQEEISFLLHQVETDYQVCITLMVMICTVLCHVHPLQPCRTMAHTTYRFDRKLK